MSFIKKRKSNDTHLELGKPGDPKQVEVVKALMKVIRTFEKVNDKGAMEEHKEYSCPKIGCTRTVTLVKNKGYTNAFSHLISCFGNKKSLHTYYKDAVTERDNSATTDHGQGSILHHFSSATANQRDTAIHAWLVMIIMKSLPVSIVEDPTFRGFCNCSEKITIKTIVKIIHQVVELVEKKIAAELKETNCGAIMHDA